VLAVAFNPAVIEMGETFVEMLPTMSASEIPASIPPFESAGTPSVIEFGALVESEPAAGRTLDAPPPPPLPHPENKREAAAITSARRTLVG